MWMQGSGEKLRKTPKRLAGEVGWAGPPCRRLSFSADRLPCLWLVTSGTYTPTAALCSQWPQSIPAGRR